MTLIKKNELKLMNANQIGQKLEDLNKELLKLNAQRAVGTTIESPGRLKLIRRTIARLITLQKSKSQKEVKVQKIKQQPKEVKKK